MHSRHMKRCSLLLFLYQGTRLDKLGEQHDLLSIAAKAAKR